MYTISRLKEFNQALVYGFEPEATAARLQGAQSYKHAFYPVVGQHIDVLNAYLYAQDEVLPYIANHGINKITPELLLKWILSLHGFIGKHLIESYSRKAGEYVNEQIYRWHHGTPMYLRMCEAFTKVAKYDSERKDLERYFLNELKMGKKTCTAFLKLIDRLREESLQDMRGNLDIRIKGLLLPDHLVKKMARAYHENTLSTEEREALSAVAIVCISPEKIPAAMQRFAEDTVAGWQACNKENLEEVSKLVAETFYQLASVHPFANCNGRTATSLINIMLKSFGLPSILLRKPGDRDNASSAYSKAIDCIDQTREPLAKHILACILEAQKKPFEDAALAKVIKLRVSLSLKCQEIEKKHPQFDIEKLVAEFDSIKIPLIWDENQQGIFMLSECLKLAKAKDTELSQKEEAAKNPVRFLASKSNPMALYNEALQLYKDKKYSESIAQFELAIEGFNSKVGEQSIEVAKCYSGLASACRETQSYEKAVQFCEKAISCLKPENTQALDAVIVKYNGCLNLRQQPTQEVYDAAIESYKNKNYRIALSQLHYCVAQWQANEGTPVQISTCYSTIASCQRDMNLISEAIASCELAMQLCPADDTRLKQRISAKHEGLLALTTRSNNVSVA